MATTVIKVGNTDICCDDTGRPVKIVVRDEDGCYHGERALQRFVDGKCVNWADYDHGQVIKSWKKK